MSLQFVLAVVAFAGACYAQVPHFGKCPDVTVEPNLNVQRYLGGWYEVKKFFFLTEIGQTCIKANYSVKDDGHLEVFNRGVTRNGSISEATGDAYAPDTNVPAKLAVSFNGSPRVPYWIVDTDYDNYSLVWSCTDFIGVAQADFAWILSRTKSLPQATLDKLMAKLASFGVETKSFMDTDQTNCPY